MRSSSPSSPTRVQRETDLYAPVRDFLQAQGFTVRAEVKGCDVAGRKGDELVIVELKRALTLELLAQAVRRQRASDSVYVAVPRPLTSVGDAKIRALLPLLRRLELGLLLVDQRETPAHLQVALQPLPHQRRRQLRVRRALLAEIDGRSGDDNTGGSNRRPLVTAYRENALFIAAALLRFGALAPRTLRALGTGPKTLTILRSDVYAWFERAGRALYRLRPAGAVAVTTYADVVARAEHRLPATLPVTTKGKPRSRAGAQ